VGGGRRWDLIVTMDDATSKHRSMFFCEQEGTWSSFRGVREVIEAKGLFCSLYTDRGSHYWTMPEAGGKVDRENLTQFGRAMAQLGIEMVPAYSPEARGRSERAFGTYQGRLPKELALDDILCEVHERTVGRDNCVRFNRLALQLPAARHRMHYMKARVKVRRHADGTLSVWHGPRRLARHASTGEPLADGELAAAA